MNFWQAGKISVQAEKNRTRKSELTHTTHIKIKIENIKEGYELYQRKNTERYELYDLRRSVVALTLANKQIVFHSYSLDDMKEYIQSHNLSNR